jgi:hypothetical protein
LEQEEPVAVRAERAEKAVTALAPSDPAAAIARFGAAARQCLPSSSVIQATSCSEAAGAFFDSTFATTIRFHDENDPRIRLDEPQA